MDRNWRPGDRISAALVKAILTQWNKFTMNLCTLLKVMLFIWPHLANESHWNHREITRTGLSGPRFHAPLHIFPPPPVRRTSQRDGRSLAAFNVTMLIMVLKNSIQLLIRYAMCWEWQQSVSKATQVLSKFYFRDTPEQDQRAWEQ